MKTKTLHIYHCERAIEKRTKQTRVRFDIVVIARSFVALVRDAYVRLLVSAHEFRYDALL